MHVLNVKELMSNSGDIFIKGLLKLTDAVIEINSTILLLKIGIEVIDTLAVPCGSNSFLPARLSVKESGVLKLAFLAYERQLCNILFQIHVL